MAHHLVVTRPFLKFVRGDVIADASKIIEILSTEHKKFVLKVGLPTTSKG
jgi:hypothetical protein